jgi:hypothetical protein
MLKKITKITLYVDNSDDSQQAIAWCEEAGLVVGADYQILLYGEGADVEAALSPLRTWSFANGQHEFTQFPFVIYSEVHEDAEPGDVLPLICLMGLEDIMGGNLEELYQLGRD